MLTTIAAKNSRLQAANERLKEKRRDLGLDPETGREPETMTRIGWILPDVFRQFEDRRNPER